MLVILHAQSMVPTYILVDVILYNLDWYCNICFICGLSDVALQLMSRGAMYTVLGSLVAALAWPATLLSATDFIDSKWTIAIDRFDPFLFQSTLFIPLTGTFSSQVHHFTFDYHTFQF